MTNRNIQKHCFPVYNLDHLRLVDTGVDGLIDYLTLGNRSQEMNSCVTYANAHTYNLSSRLRKKGIHYWEEFDLVYTDGMSVVKEIRRRGEDWSERVSAADFFWRFLWVCASREISLSLIGGREGLTKDLSKFAISRIPGLKVGFNHHGFLEDKALRENVIMSLARTKPGIVLLGMGSPQQEEFALELAKRLENTVIWCVGALFEYFLPGERRHAPLWMRENGLEWAFRLSQEPRRLAGRYLAGNMEFILRTRGFIR